VITKYPRINLSEPQKRIVEHLDGPLLVSAGPGSGKTRVIVERIAYMLNNGINPESILATTFTRKAADEMNSRLSAKDIDTGRMSVQTMHALCWRIIRAHKSYKGWKVDDKDVHRIVLKTILGYKQMNWVGVDISKVEEFISAARNSLVSPENSAGFMAPHYRDQRYSQAYFAYHEQMQERRLITFDDMLYYGVWLLETDNRTLDTMQGKYLYVMVDEFQDSNFAQLQLAELLASPEFNYVAVGDIDQAIYSWRGALPEFMLEFAEKYGAEIVELGVNYRCAPAIMNAAANCIVKNERRFSKELEANRTNEARIHFIQAADTDEEALMVREEIEAIKEDGVGYGNMRVLMRTNAQSRAIEEEFVRAKIPFVVLGSLSFYDRKEIADLLAYLRVLYDPRDTKAGGRAINRPFRYINRQILDDIEDTTMRGGNYIDAAANRLENTRLGSARDWCEMMGGFSVETDAPADVIRTVVQETDYIDYLMDAEGTDTPETSRAGNVGELIASATRFKTIPEFIEYVDMQIKLRKRNQRKQADSRVQVMTIHKAKGTEANTIFLIGASDGIIPHTKGDEEEERRLFYVAITRAKDRLIVSMTSGQTFGGNVGDMQPSRFAYEAGIVPDEERLTDSSEDDMVGDLSEGKHAHTENVSCESVESIHRRDKS
jgi:DNA helicase-2/ATP-dependent DNA helicase PcrA